MSLTREQASIVRQICLLFLISLSMFNTPLWAEESTGHRQESFSLPVRIVDGPPRTAEDAAKEAQTDKRETDDLVAQQSMAQSTEQIVWLSIAQLVLGVASTMALLYSLHLNRWSARNAMEANRFTRDAIDYEHANAQRELRAYIGVTEVSLIVPGQYKPQTTEGETADTSLLIRYRNFGQTPASDLVCFGYFVIFKDFRPMKEAFENALCDEHIVAMQKRNSISRFILNGNQEHETKVPIFKEEDRQFLSDFHAQRCDLYVFGNIHFTDCFEKSWKLNFCHVRDRNSDQFIPYEHFNRLQAMPHLYPSGA